MKIVDYELFNVPPRWLFLKVVTDEGTVGWGEPTVEGHTPAAAAVVSEIFDTYLLGKDPMAIERHWQFMYRGQHFRSGPILMSAIAGIDQALWDIKGKHLGVPVYELLGGRVRDRARIYQWVGGEDADEMRASAADAVERGYRSVKIAPTPKLRRMDTPEAVAVTRRRLAAVREAVGDDVDVGVDLRGRVSRSMVRRMMDALDPYEPMFYEVPVLPGHLDKVSHLAQFTSTPLASGERFYTRLDFESVIDRGNVDVIQPNPSHAGGISETRRIATMAESRGVGVSLHCPLGPISFASGLQLMAAVQNVHIQSQHLNVDRPNDNDRLAYLRDPEVFDFRDGYVDVLEGAGLGIEIDESVVESKQTDDTSWHVPTWYHEDGSIAEW